MSNEKPFSAKLFLLKEMVVRDLKSRYAGAGLGVLVLGSFMTIMFMRDRRSSQAVVEESGVPK